jgi:hypothetical protein
MPNTKNLRDALADAARVARVGWVEAIAETHHNPRLRMMGFALLYPSYSGNGGKRMEECGLPNTGLRPCIRASVAWMELCASRE